MAPLIIKVCGMTEAENIRNVEQLDVDMIGFIFYPKSPRCLCEIPAYLPVRAKRVGVFVNESKETILMYADRFALDYIQLHGNESPGYCRSLRSSGLHLIKAFPFHSQKTWQPFPTTRDYAIITSLMPRHHCMAAPATSSTGTCCTVTAE